MSSSYPPPPSGPPGGMPPYYGGGGYGGGPTQPPPPPNQLVPAIVTTLLCCLPLGIVSLVYANQVNNKYQAGDYNGAVEASKKAKNWWIASIATTAVLIVLWIIFVVGLGVMSDT